MLIKDVQRLYYAVHLDMARTRTAGGAKEWLRLRSEVRMSCLVYGYGMVGQLEVWTTPLDQSRHPALFTILTNQRAPSLKWSPVNAANLDLSHVVEPHPELPPQASQRTQPRSHGKRSGPLAPEPREARGLQVASQAGCRRRLHVVPPDGYVLPPRPIILVTNTTPRPAQDWS